MRVCTWSTLVDADSPGHRPAEEYLTQWAESKGFSPVQAQGLLCNEQVYTISARKKLELTKEYNANAGQKYNASRQQLSAAEQNHAPSVGMLKVQLNPMHPPTGSKSLLCKQGAVLMTDVCS